MLSSYFKIEIKKKKSGLIVQTCKPFSWELQEDRWFKASLGNLMTTCLKTCG